MTRSARQPHIGKFWYFSFSLVLILLYAGWWIFFVYVPYRKKRIPIESQIAALSSSIEEKRELLARFQKTRDHFNASMASIKALRERLPYLSTIPRFVKHLKERGLKQDLIVEEAVSDVYLAPPLFPPETLIQSVGLSLWLKGDFIAIGKFMQDLDEKDSHFCYIRGVTLERSSARNFSVLALVKLEIFCRKDEAEGHDLS